MKRPPLLMRAQFGGQEGSLPLWLPLFLLLPLALSLVIILSPLILVAIVILRVTGRASKMPTVARAFLRILCSVRGIRAAFDVLCSVPGLRVDVSDGNDRVHIRII
jgi:hypothetical protein